MPKKGRQLPSKTREFDVISSFGNGYRNREDITNLPPNTLITGSQNVLTNVSGRIGARKGYTLDGAADTSISSILGAYDYEVAAGGVRNVRGGFLTSAGNDGKLQFRYDDGTTVTWYTLESSQASTNYNFTRWWDTTRVMSLMLYVNHTGAIKEWSGGVGIAASATSNSVTISGTNTIAQNGFYTTGTHSLWIAGVAYGYTGISGNTFTTVTPDPSATAVGTIVYQKPESTTNAAMSLALTTNDLISQLNNHIYVGSLVNNIVYVSKDTDYKNFTYTSPTRLPGEGAILTLNAPPRALWPQEDRMYVSSGLGDWGVTQFLLSGDNTAESLTYRVLNTVPLQGSQSQALTTKIRNNILFISNEPVLTTWGRVDGVFPVPQATDISAPIVNDMNDYDFTGGSMAYFRKFVYIAAPRENTVLVYNMTDPKNPYWEAPQILPVGRFSIIGGELYGHSSQVSETYKLFTGHADRVTPDFNGFPISAKWVFSYQNYGTRFSFKKATKYYCEGYISAGATLTAHLTYELDGCKTIKTFHLDGDDSQFVCVSAASGPLGKMPLGKVPLGGDVAALTNGLPPKFRWFPTFSNTDFFEVSPSFESLGVDTQVEILAFGLAASSSTQIPVQNMD